MNNTLNYKEFVAKIEFDARDNIFVSRVIDKDIISFHADSVEGLHNEMKATIDFHIEICENRKVKKLL